MRDTTEPLVKFGNHFSLQAIFKAFWGRILTTWGIVVIENVLIATIPFLIGLSIDGLLAKRLDELLLMIAALVLLVLIAVGRRVYDTRAYGTIRVHLGLAVDKKNAHEDVSSRNARLDMSRELVDFLEQDVPELLTALIQVVVSFAVLAYFHLYLGLSSIAILLAMVIFYSFFHKRFYRLNATLNSYRERQVTLLGQGDRFGIFRHLSLLRATEVSISDTEALVYGGIFLLQILYIAFNLYFGAGLPDLTAGRIFSIATYSWEYVEAALALPMALQGWSRLSEITARIQNQKSSEPKA